MTPQTHLSAVQDFLAHKRIALYGLSTHPEDFSHAVYKEMVARGYDVVPVHPTATELEGRPVVHSLGELDRPVEGALLMTPPSHSAEAVQDALSAGVRRIWLHRGVGQGAVSEEALQLCASAQVDVVAGQCPLMFLEDAGWIHDVHGWCKKLVGTWPA